MALRGEEYRVDFPVTRTSMMSGKQRTITLRVDPADVERYMAGELIQKCFPYLSDNDREFIMTGVTPDEWDELFGEDDDEEESDEEDPDPHRPATRSMLSGFMRERSPECAGCEFLIEYEERATWLYSEPEGRVQCGLLTGQDGEYSDCQIYQSDLEAADEEEED